MSDQQTWMELVRENWPGISDEDAERVLFNATCFPFGTEELVVWHLKQKYQQSGGDPDRAMTIALEELDAAMAEIRALDDTMEYFRALEDPRDPT